MQPCEKKSNFDYCTGALLGLMRLKIKAAQNRRHREVNSVCVTALEVD